MDLPHNLPDCHAMIVELTGLLQDKEVFIRKLQHQLEQLLRHRYGQRADRLHPGQLVFEAMAEMLRQIRSGEMEKPKAEAESPKTKKGAPRPGHGRKPLPEHLPRVRVEHEVPLEERMCARCDREMDKIGEEVSERLEYEPACLRVLQDVCPKYACKQCEDAGVVIAAKPLQPIEKGLPGPGLLAYVATSKYADHLPLNRLEGILGRQGVDLSRKTLCDWMASCADLALPIYDRMKEGVLQSEVIWTDDTPVQVQDKDLPGKTRTGRIWIYVGDEHHPFNVYDYTTSRSRDGPVNFLRGFSGHLQADAYGGYDGIYAGDQVKEVGCWAHTRRKYVEAQSTDLIRAVFATATIKLLYRVEERAGTRSPADRQALRREESKPILDRFEEWLREQEGLVLPKSPIGQAIGYTLNNWKALNRYIENPDLTIDNNIAERGLRCIAVGRGNWIFFGSDRGGRTAAVLYSLVGTCKRHGIDPFRYLRDLFARISAHPASRLDELLPPQWKASQASAPQPAAAVPLNI